MCSLEAFRPLTRSGRCLRPVEEAIALLIASIAPRYGTGLNSYHCGSQVGDAGARGETISSSGRRRKRVAKIKAPKLLLIPYASQREEP
jgi:hypothetical protein